MFMMSALTSSAVQPVCWEWTSAASPATSGDDIDVPVNEMP